MAVGKNKGLSKGSKKGSKKKVIDPFSRKDWYDIKAPSLFANRQMGKTLVNRTQGTKIASEGLKGRVFEDTLDSLQNDRSKEGGRDGFRSYHKFRFIAEDVQGTNVLTNFYGMELTSDKIRFMVRKWQTLIEANVDVKTTDGYLLRVFCIAFTCRDQQSKRKTCYAQHSTIRAIRKKMCEIIATEFSSDMKEIVRKLIADTFSKDIQQACKRLALLHDVHVRKVKVLKKPRFDLSRLLELHGDGGGSHIDAEATGKIVERPETQSSPPQFVEPQVSQPENWD